MMRHRADNESLARALAAAAHIDWASLPDYPGFGKTIGAKKRAQSSS